MKEFEFAAIAALAFCIYSRALSHAEIIDSLNLGPDKMGISVNKSDALYIEHRKSQDLSVQQFLLENVKDELRDSSLIVEGEECYIPFGRHLYSGFNT